MILLLTTSFHTVQGQEKCAYLESRISAFHGIENTLTMKFDIQFYNPNSEDVLYAQSSYSFPELNISGNLVDKNSTAYPSITLMLAINVINFSPGVSTIPISIRVGIIAKNDTMVSLLPDGNYTVNYYYSKTITSYPAILTVKSGAITAEIPEPDWEYDKQGSYTERYPVIGDANFVCRLNSSLLLYVILGILLLAIIVVVSLVVRRRLRSKKS